MLSDPLTIAGVFTLGAAAGSLIDYARHRHVINECRKALELSAVNVSQNEDATLHYGMKALAVGCDPEMVGIFSHLFREIHFETHKCALESAAIDRLSHEKFDALVLDVDDVAGYADILKGLKGTGPNEHVVVFAIASDSRAKETASALGAAFIIERPLVPAQIRDLLRRVYGRMLHDRQIAATTRFGSPWSSSPWV